MERRPGAVGGGAACVLPQPHFLVFTLALPILMLVVFGSVFITGDFLPEDAATRDVFIPGIIAIGVMSTCFQSLAISVALDRETG